MGLLGTDVSIVIEQESIRQIRADISKCIEGQISHKADWYVNVTVWDFVHELVWDELFQPVVLTLSIQIPIIHVKQNIKS